MGAALVLKLAIISWTLNVSTTGCCCRRRVMMVTVKMMMAMAMGSGGSMQQQRARDSPPRQTTISAFQRYGPFGQLLPSDNIPTTTPLSIDYFEPPSEQTQQGQVDASSFALDNALNPEITDNQQQLQTQLLGSVNAGSETFAKNPSVTTMTQLRAKFTTGFRARNSAVKRPMTSQDIEFPPDYFNADAVEKEVVVFTNEGVSLEGETFTTTTTTKKPKPAAPMVYYYLGGNNHAKLKKLWSFYKK